MSQPTLYEVLGLTVGAEQREITRAFRQRSLETHPDKNPDDPDAGSKFIAVVKAYQTLSDVHLRAAYDARVFAGQSVTARYGVTLVDALEAEYYSVMDSRADDVLEEYVVGNRPPAETSMTTFFRDLESTEVFILLREGKAAYYERDYERAATVLQDLIERNPTNILARYYYGLALFESGKTIKSFRELRWALHLGQHRVPQRQCPGVRRALYDLYRRRWCYVSAWLLARNSPALFVDPIGVYERERLRLKRMTIEEDIRIQRQDEIARRRLAPRPSSTRALPRDTS